MTTCGECYADVLHGNVTVFCDKHAKMIEEHPFKVALIAEYIKTDAKQVDEIKRLNTEMDCVGHVQRLLDGTTERLTDTMEQLTATNAEVERLKVEVERKEWQLRQPPPGQYKGGTC